MIKNPMNTKTLYAVIVDFNIFPGTPISEEVYTGESRAEALKIAKKYGEKALWHVIERKCIACSDQANTERDERLYGSALTPAA